jgi:hypothetical protein
MSVHESSDAARPALAPFTRWPGLLRLALDVLGGPVIALIHQEVIYAGDMWACGHNLKWSLHIAAALCFVAAVAVTVDSFVVWRTIGRGVEDEFGNEETRTRFLAALGMMVGAISVAVVAAEWLAVFVFGACMRA